MRKSLLFSLTMLCLCQSALAQDQLLLRHPAINKDGSRIAFSFQGDIWTVPASGGAASRLTIHEAYESTPVFSPDGSRIAFSGSRFGNNDIFSIPTDGGLPIRHTFHSSADNLVSWTLADQIVFSTNREFNQIERPAEVYSIAPNGGTERRILDAVAHDPVYSPDGRFIALVRGDINPVAREDYRGPSNRDLWLYDTQSKKFSKLPGFETNDIMPQWADKRTLYFLSSNDGTYNLYRLKINDDGSAIGTAEKITNYKDEAIRHYSVSADGQTIVFEKDMRLYTMKPADKNSAKPLAVTIRADERLDATDQKTLSTGLETYTLSPNGKWLAFTIRGEVFVKEADKEKSRSVNVSNHAYRDMEPEWLNDSTLLFISDRNNGNFDLYAVRSADTAQPALYYSLKHEVSRVTNTPLDESSPVVSNNGKRIAFNRGRGSFIVADIDKAGKLSRELVLLNNGWGNPSGVAWSPDDQYLAYGYEDLYFNEEIFIHDAENKQAPVNVSMHPRGDRNPVWSADGSKLGFISGRSNRNNDVWFVWLKKADWEKDREDWTDSPEEPKKETATRDKKEVKKIQIDFESIHERVLQVTNFPGEEGDLAISRDGEIFYYTASSSTANGRDLYSIKWNGRELKELTKGGSNPAGVMLDRQGKFLYFARRGALSRIDPKTSVQEPLPFAAKMNIDYAKEKEQVFEEAWRTIRDGFYDPGFHGNDWKKLREKYRDRCLAASTSQDFRDMFNLMLGELNASHMGLTVPDRVETQQWTTGLAGAEMEPVANGMRVKRVVPETPASKLLSALKSGDVVTAVNGSDVAASTNFYAMMNGLSGDRVLFSVAGADGKNREVAIRPASNIRQQLYQEWVNDRKKLVDKYSGGKLGYIHIQGMNMPSFEVFERELTAAGYGKDGLVVDVRYNGGGSTTDYLMAVLNYKQHAYTIPRGASDNPEKDKLKYRDYYPTGERLVFAAWLKPSVAICNEGSYSNAEIFSHAYKQLGIGKLVGVPTNGSVISTGGRGLLDGSFVRLPFRGWYTKATDKNQELGPAIPDIIVENDPDWIARGEDKQLKAAVEVLLKEGGK